MIKIFIQNAASFDFAFLTDRFGPRGKSFYLDVVFQGTIDETGMLIDFSQAKKIIKLIIKEFDHTLLVLQKHVKNSNKSHIIVCNHSETLQAKHQQSCNFISDGYTRKTAMNFFAMHTNRSWVKIVPDDLLKSLQENEATLFENFIAQIILEHVPQNITDVSVQLKEKSEKFTQNIFDYTHTLCHHKGNCQRFHGHSAQVQVFKNKLFDKKLSIYAAQKMQGLYIVSNQHFLPSFQSVNLNKIKKHCFQKKHFDTMKNDLRAFEYQGSRGKVSIIISSHLSVLLPHESTIESITRYIFEHISQTQNAKNREGKILKNIEVLVYEGLSKGAVIS